MVTLYKPNADFDKAFAHSEEARDYALRKAREAAQYARESAPVATGAYRDSIEAVVVEEDDGWKGKVIADVPYAVYLEFGTEDTPTFATLRRAGETIERT